MQHTDGEAFNPENGGLAHHTHPLMKTTLAGFTLLWPNYKTINLFVFFVFVGVFFF